MQRLGILSDSHGCAARTRKAVGMLLERGADRIIHLGDVGNESILDVLAGHNATVVFGNCDDERALARYAECVGIRVVHPGAIIEVKPSESAKSVRIGMTHGHLEHEVARLFASEVDVLLHGHTHEIRDEQIGTTRVMNPGALHRAARHTVLLFEAHTGIAEWLDVDAPDG